MSNNLRTRNGMPFNFVNGLKVRGMDIESLIPGIEGIPEAGSKYQFAGNGSNKAFTLPVTPYNKDAVDVYVKQLYVHPDDYTLVGDTVTLTEAPPAVVAGETYNVVIKVSLTTLNGYVNANRVSFEGENLDDILEKGKPLANYSALRAYAGAATQVRITDPGIAGFFYYDASDTSSADNGGTIIVSSNGKRWKRTFSGDIEIFWFMSTSQIGDVTARIGSVDVTAAVMAAIAEGNNKKCYIYFPPGIYLITQPIVIPDNGTRGLRGSGRESTVLKMSLTSGVALSIQSYYTRSVSLCDLSVSLSDQTQTVSGIKVALANDIWGSGIVCARVNIVNFTETALDLQETFLGNFTECEVRGGLQSGNKVARLLKSSRVTTFGSCVTFTNVIFHIGKIGFQNFGGTTYHFESCGFEALQLFMNVKQLAGLSMFSSFNSCWFEDISQGIINAEINETTLQPILPVQNKAELSRFSFRDCIESSGTPSIKLDQSVEPFYYNKFNFRFGIDKTFVDVVHYEKYTNSNGLANNVTTLRLISQNLGLSGLNYAPFNNVLRQGQYTVTLEASGYNGAKMYAVFMSAGFQAPFQLIGVITDSGNIGSDYKLRLLWADSINITAQGYGQGLTDLNAYVSFVPFKA